MVGEIQLAYLIDQIVPEPKKYHPVSSYGKFSTYLEELFYSDSKISGGLFALANIELVAFLAVLLKKYRIFGLVAVTAISLSGKMLEDEALEIYRSLKAGNIERAKKKLPSLVGRDVDSLDERGIVRATVESIAENTVDAVASTLVLGSVFGVFGVLLHRVFNTLDAMVGKKNSRYLNFGMACARIDDLLNYVPARVSSVIVLGFSKSPVKNLKLARQQALLHPSPNAGIIEASFALALNIELGGELSYQNIREVRPIVGTGGEVRADDILRATHLKRKVEYVLLVLTLALSLVVEKLKSIKREIK